MSDDVKEPCSNFDECQDCYSEPFFIVSTTRIEKRTHQRRIRAANAEEALAQYKEGTAWPSDYDDTKCMVLSSEPTIVAEEDREKTSRRWEAIKDTSCYHRLEPLPPGGITFPAMTCTICATTFDGCQINASRCASWIHDDNSYGYVVMCGYGSKHDMSTFAFDQCTPCFDDNVVVGDVNVVCDNCIDTFIERHALVRIKGPEL